MAQWVEPGKAEMRLGAKPVEAPRPVLNQPRRVEPGLGTGRQYLCIAPEQKSRADPGERSSAVPSAPIKASQHSRSELRHRHKR